MLNILYLVVISRVYLEISPLLIEDGISFSAQFLETALKMDWKISCVKTSSDFMIFSLVLDKIQEKKFSWKFLLLLLLS